MKTKKLIRNALAVLTIVFMSAVLCGAGCSNAADSSSGGTSLNAIEKQIAGGSITDGSDVYKFFADKRGEKSSGSSPNMRSARAAGGVGFSWSADLSGTLTIVMDSGGSALVFKFTVTNGVLGTCKKGDTTVTFAPTAPTSLDAAAILRQYPAWYEADVRISTNKLSGIGKHRFENGKVFFVDGLQICNYTTSGSSVIITFTDGTTDSIDFSMLVDCDKLPNTDENGGVVTHNKAGCKMLYFGDNGSGEIVSWHSHEIK